MARPTIAEVAASVCEEHGALTLDELTSELVARGVTKAKNPRAAVSQAIGYDYRLIELRGGRWVARSALLRGRVFTYRLTGEDLSRGEIILAEDLAPLALRRRNGIQSSRGELEVVLDYPKNSLRGPAGWLSDCTEGDLLAFAFGTEPLEITRVTDPVADVLDQALREKLVKDLELLARHREEDELVVTAFSAAVEELVAEHPEALTRPGLPLTERVGDLEVRYGFAARPGTDWSVWEDGWDLEDDPEVEELARSYALTEAQANRLGELIAATDELGEGRPVTDLVPRLTEHLADPRVLSAFRGWSQVEGDPEAVTSLMTAVADSSTGPTRGAALHVAALAAEELDEHATAEDRLRAALFADPHDPEVRYTAARYASDRGDAAEALTHLRSAGVPFDDPEIARLRPFAEPPPSTVGRNHPCPCGSGRKHKLCCLREARHPLGQRAPWLWQKLAQWTREPRQRFDLMAVAQVLEPEGGLALYHRCNSDPLTADIALWSTGLLQQFLASRGPVLPEDERQLLESWCDEGIRLVEVLRTQPGVSLLVRDMETDEQLEVRDKLGSRHTPVGTVLATRLLPNGDGQHILSFALDVPRMRRPLLATWLRDADSREQALVGWYVQALRPPAMTNRYGHELVHCTGSWDVPPSAREALSTELGAWTDDSLVWLDGQSIKATFTMNGVATLEATTMSRETWQEAEQLVARLVPDAELLEMHALPAADVASGDVSPLHRATAELDPTPELAEALDAYVQEHERRWVSEPVPALGGLTPIQALDDPVMRREVLNMLGDMDGAPGTMDPYRVRALLGLV